MKPSKSRGRRNPGILLRFIIPMLLLMISLQAACPVLCGSAALCLTQKTDQPGTTHSCCQSRKHASENRSDRPAPRPCCCADGMLLSKAQVPEPPDGAASAPVAVAMVVALLFPTEPLPGPARFPGPAEDERSKPPPLSRAELNIYRI